MSAVQTPFAHYEKLQQALRPIDDPPQPPGWNAAELSDVFPSHEPRLPAAVLVPLIGHKEGTTVLFTRRAEQMRTHAGQISFPGGRIEPHDTNPIAAALRETHEETGIDPCHIKALGYLDSLVTISGYCVAPVVGWVDTHFCATPDAIEVAEIFEVPFDYILAPGCLQRQSIEWRGRTREVFEFHWQGRRIWGATAAILVNLIQRLERV